MHTSKGFKDITGHKYGHLTAIKYHGSSKEGSMWECKCICGRIIIRPRYRLIHAGINSSCGCVKMGTKSWIGAYNHIDLTGKQVGMLTVISKKGKSWLCKCKCGKFIVRRSDLLTRTNLHPEYNCGCLAHGYKNTNLIDHAKKYLINHVRYGAKRRGITYCVPDKDIAALFDMPCYYCGAPVSNTFKSKLKCLNGAEYRYNGIDRLDNSQGYITDNIVPCCRVCNESKMDRTKDEYIAHCIAVIRTSTDLYES